MNPLLQSALTHFQEGRSEQARLLARQVRENHPQDADAWHLESLAVITTGNPLEAWSLIQEAVRLAPHNPEANNTLGACALTLGKHEEALNALQRALSLAPHNLPAHANLARLHQQTGRHREALDAWKTVLELDPSHTPAIRGLLQLAGATDQPDIAGEAMALVVQRAPNQAMEAIFSLVHQALEGGSDTLAEALSGPVEKQADRDTKLKLANLWFQHHRIEEAIQRYRRLLQSYPHDPDLQNNLAAALTEQGHYEEAADLLRTVLIHHPLRRDALTNLTTCLTDDGKLAEAEEIAHRAITTYPDHPSGYINLTTILYRQGRFHEAEEAARKALQLAPEDPRAWNNLGNAQHALGQHREAAESLKHALDLRPDYPDARYTLGMIQLLLGQFQEGWENYFYRPRHIRIPETLTPITPGADVAGQRILLVSAQGLGDELFFLRWAAQLRQRGAYVAYRCSKKLTGILHRHAIVDQLLAPEEALLNADAVYTVDDLPLLLGTPASLPPPLPLHPDPERVANWKNQLADLGPPPYLALAWRAGRPEMNTARYRFLDKNISLPDIARIARRWPGTLLSIQRAPRPGETETLSRLIGRPVHDLSVSNDDLEEALALLSLVDETLGVSNTNIHLRAGLGLPGQVLIPNPPEWRWMAEGESSPWFPNYRVHRQAPDGDWKSALEHLESNWP